MLNKIVGVFVDLGRELFASVVALGVGALLIYLIATNAEGISDFILNFGK